MVVVLGLEEDVDLVRFLDVLLGRVGEHGEGEVTRGRDGGFGRFGEDSGGRDRRSGWLLWGSLVWNHI